MASPFDRQQIGVWLASLGASEPTTPASFERALADLLEIQTMLDEMHAALGRRPELLVEARPLLEQIVSRRRSLLAKVGEQALSWMLLGGKVELGPAELVATRAALDAARPVPPPPASPSPPPSPPLAEPSAAPEPPPPPESIPTPVVIERGRVEPRATPSGDYLGESERGMLHTFLDLAGPPRDLSSTMSLIDELDGLEALADTMERWPFLPKPVQRQLLGMLVARLRAVKEIGGLSPGIRLRIKDLLSLCPTYAKAHPLGAHVNGLQVAHEPQGASWRADAKELWDGLQHAAG